MELEIVNFEQAKALKELGFYGYSSNECELYVTSNEITWEQAIETYGDGYDYITHHGTFPVNVVGELLYDVREKNICFARNFQTVYAPTLELAAKWLRDEKDICVVVTEYTGGDRDISRTYRVDIHYNVTNEYGTFRETEYIDYKNQNSKDMDNWEYFTKYEEALSAGIDKAIEILKMNN